MNSNLKSYKVVVLGESTVGKSSLVERFVQDHFNPYMSSTVGASFYTKTVNINDRIIKLDIWDTAGQERFHCLAPMYYRGSNAVLIVYDITSRESFSCAKMWLKEIESMYDLNHMPVVRLIGNKIDLEESRFISWETLNDYCNDHLIGGSEVSAKTGANVIDLFHEIGQEIVDLERRRLGLNPNLPNHSIDLKPLTLKSSGYCC